MQHISAALSELLASGQLGSRSRFAVRTAADAAQTDGVAGVLVIQLPPRIKDFPECSFTIGTVDLITRWEGVN